MSGLNRRSFLESAIFGAAAGAASGGAAHIDNIISNHSSSQASLRKAFPDADQKAIERHAAEIDRSRVVAIGVSVGLVTATLRKFSI